MLSTDVENSHLYQASLEDPIPVDENTVFEVASMHPLKQNADQTVVPISDHMQSDTEPPTNSHHVRGRGSLDMIRRSLDFIRLKAPVQDENRSSLDQTNRRMSGGEGNDEIDGNTQAHAVAGTATLAEHLLIRSLEKDFAKLLVLEIRPPCQSVFRSDLNRLDLLAVCRQQAGPLGASRESSKGGRDPTSGPAGSALQLRDLRCLQVLGLRALLPIPTRRLNPQDPSRPGR